jgi:hypothetical protein
VSLRLVAVRDRVADSRREAEPATRLVSSVCDCESICEHRKLVAAERARARVQSDVYHTNSRTRKISRRLVFAILCVQSRGGSPFDQHRRRWDRSAGLGAVRGDIVPPRLVTRRASQTAGQAAAAGACVPQLDRGPFPPGHDASKARRQTRMQSGAPPAARPSFAPGRSTV